VALIFYGEEITVNNIVNKIVFTMDSSFAADQRKKRLKPRAL